MTCRCSSPTTAAQHNIVVRETGAETPMLNAGDNATRALGTLDVGNYEVTAASPATPSRGSSSAGDHQHAGADR